MPRICSSSSDPYDYCRSCFPTELVARRVHGNSGAGPDGRGDCFDYDSDHPPYDGEDYTCHKCRKPLTAIDDTPTPPPLKTAAELNRSIASMMVTPFVPRGTRHPYTGRLRKW
jgi:hypothetical protein